MKKTISFFLVIVLISIVATGIFYATNSSLQASLVSSQTSSLFTPNVGWNNKSTAAMWDGSIFKLAVGWNTRKPTAFLLGGSIIKPCVGWNG